MANDVFDITRDIEVSIYGYASDVMVWSVSRWDEDEWGGVSDTQDWRVISGGVANVTINNGCLVSQGLVRAEPATATVTFQDPDYDPFNNVSIRTGTPIRIRVQTIPDSMPSWQTLFVGAIENAVASYSKDWTNLVTVTAVTEMRALMNFTSPTGITVAGPTYLANYITELNAVGDFNIIPSGLPGNLGYQLVGISQTTPVYFGGLINQLLDTSGGALVYTPITAPNNVAVWFTQQQLGEVRDRTTNVEFEAAPSANFKRADFSDITIGFNTEDIVNSLTYTIPGSPEVNLTNVQSRDLLGELSLNVATLHNDGTEALEWASGLGARLPERSVRDITAPIVTRAGQINLNLLREPFDVAKVSVSNPNITIEEQYFITRIVQVITPHSWDATFTLWKGR